MDEARASIHALLRALPPPRRIVFWLTEQDTETTHGSAEFTMKELQNAQHHNHIYNKTFINVHN